VTTSTVLSQTDWLDPGSNDPTMLPGMSITPSAGTFCCNDSVGGTTPGLGTATYTFNPGAAGTYQVNMYFDHDLSTAGPAYNEYGVVDPNTAGAPPAGISYAIFDADNPTGAIALYGATGGAENYGNPGNTNGVPGTASNFVLGQCVANCNADVGMALGYSFTLSAGQEAVITASTSLTNPGGWALEQIHPVDPSNPSETDLYLTGALSIQAIPSAGSGTPEPSTWILFGSALLLLAGNSRIRKALKA